MVILNDFKTSVERALKEIDPKYKKLPGVVVCGTHSPNPKHIEKILLELKRAREKKIPVLGICFGMQMMAIEYARNVLGIKDATSEEFGYGTLVVKKLKKIKVGLHDDETWWNKYSVDPRYITGFGTYYSGGIIAKIMLDNYIGVQFHPEYQSSKGNPHQVLVDFINQCKKYNE